MYVHDVHEHLSYSHIRTFRQASKRYFRDKFFCTTVFHEENKRSDGSSIRFSIVKSPQEHNKSTLYIQANFLARGC